MAPGTPAVSATSTKISGSSTSWGWKKAKQRRSGGSRRSRKSSQGADLMHGFVADDLLEDVGGRRPIDRPQHQKAGIEPGGEEMREVVVDAVEAAIFPHGSQQLFAHAHQRRRAARREIEATDELLATRFGGRMQFQHRLRVRSGAIGVDRQRQPDVVVAELVDEAAQEGEARLVPERLVARKDRARERDARGFAATGKQGFAKRGEIALALGPLRPAPAPQERAAAIRDAGEKIAEEGVAHAGLPRTRMAGRRRIARPSRPGATRCLSHDPTAKIVPGYRAQAPPWASTRFGTAASASARPLIAANLTTPAPEDEAAVHASHSLPLFNHLAGVIAHFVARRNAPF